MAMVFWDLNLFASISQEFGGGGHRNASSFMLSSTEFQKWKIWTHRSKQKADFMCASLSLKVTLYPWDISALWEVKWVSCYTLNYRRCAKAWNKSQGFHVGRMWDSVNGWTYMWNEYVVMNWILSTQTNLGSVRDGWWRILWNLSIMASCQLINK